MKQLGLSPQEVTKLQLLHGPNSLPEERPFSVFTLLIAQLKSPLIYVLFGVIAISLFFREYLDVILILAIIVLNVVMGFAQEYSAQKTLLALKKIIKPSATVIRSGVRQVIDASGLVPGDVVLLGSGDTIPADGIVLNSVDLLVGEAILTGEAEPVEKSTAKTHQELFMGTAVASGRGTMLVVRIGLHTEFGKIGKSLTKITDAPTPLQIKLEKFSRTLVIIIGFISLLIFIIGLYLKQDLWNMFRYSIVLSVAAIPEGLPIAVTVILSLGVRRILKKDGLVKKLLSIETLGATSVICTDKTGTLTEGVMRVVKTNFKDHRDAMKALILLNTQRTSLEIAIWRYLKKELGSDPQTYLDKAEIIYEEAFESDKKHALTIAKVGETTSVFIIGAPEVIIGYCHESQKEKARIIYEFEDWARAGLRVVGLCEKLHTTSKAKSGFKWVGLIGVKDPVRKTVAESIARARSAGIDVKIVTGDHLHTTLNVAQEVGLKVGSQGYLEGKDLDQISLAELQTKIKGITLFARVAPIQKLKIIEALQANGEVVAMTGDGVNDGPALKKANIGIAVGSATDVAKSASDIILLDSDFKTIVSAVEEGRIIFANIKKVVAYVLSNSLAEIFLIIGALVLHVPLPLSIVQILWVHLICDGPPDIVLGFEPKETGIMLEKPRKLINESILEFPMILLILTISLTVGLVALFAFTHEFTGQNLTSAQTVAFAVIGSIDLTYIFAYKDLKKSIFRMNLFDNKFLIGSVIYGFVLLFLGIYHPVLNRLLGTTPLTFSHWLYPLIASVITIIWVELVKYFRVSTLPRVPARS